MLKILCVEDEAALREDLVEVLEEEGYEVEAACNGEEGLLALTRFKPDLVLSDCLMPVMDGVAMLKAIRTDHPQFAATPIVFLSAHAQKAHVEAGMETGAQHYLTKPVDFAELVDVVRRLLDDSDDAKDGGTAPQRPAPGEK